MGVLEWRAVRRRTARRGQMCLSPLWNFTSSMNFLMFCSSARGQISSTSSVSTTIYSLQAADDGDLLRGKRDDRRTRVVEVAPLGRHGVGVAVLARVLVDRAPRADVAPAEFAAADVNVVGLFHDAVVDRDGAALREGDLHHVALGVGPQGAHHPAEEGVVLGEVLLERFDDRADLPDEDARVPEKLARLQEDLRQFQVGLLREALDLADGAAVRDLDVAVSRVGARGLDADGHQRVVLRGEGEALGDDPAGSPPR